MRWITASIVFLALSLTLDADEIRGKVVRVADGDTITVLDAAMVQHKIRLQGIDAPEKKQAFGTRSKERITDKIAGRDVVVKWKEKDRYGRILGEVVLGEVPRRASGLTRNRYRRGSFGSWQRRK